MKRRFAKLMLIMTLILQMGASAVSVLSAEDRYLYQDEFVAIMAQQDTPEQIFDGAAPLPEKGNVVRILMNIDGQALVDKMLVYKQGDEPKDIQIKGQEGYEVQSVILQDKELENKDALFKGEIKFNKYANKVEKTIIINVSSLSSLTIHYQDEAQQTIAPSEVLKESLNKEVSIKAKDIQGYIPSQTEIGVTLDQQQKEIIFVYAKQEEKVASINNDRLFYTGVYILKLGNNTSETASSYFFDVDALKTKKYNKGDTSSSDFLSSGGYSNYFKNNDGIFGKYYYSWNKLVNYETNSILKNVPPRGTEFNPRLTPSDYFYKMPTQDTIERAIATQVTNGQALNPKDYDVTWYRIVERDDGFHVDGYLTRKAASEKASIAYIIDDEIKSNIEVNKGSILDASQVYVPTPASNQYFDGWYEMEDYTGVKLSNDQLIGMKITENKVFYGRYLDKSQVSITFDLNGGYVDGSSKVLQYTVYKNETLTSEQSVPSPEKPGFTFTGRWEKVGDSSKTYTNAEIAQMSFANATTFKAQYERNLQDVLTYTVNYYQDDASKPFAKEEKKIWAGNPVVTSVSYENMPTGYKLDTERSTKLDYTVTKDHHQIDVYYVKDSANTLRYTVEYYQDDENTPFDRAEKEVWVGNPIVKKVEYANKPLGYKLDTTRSTTLPVEISTVNHVIKVVYTKDLDDTLDYQVNYYLNNATIPIAIEHKSIWIADAVVTSVSYENMPKGYKLDATRSTPLPYTVTPNEKTINVYYVKDDSKEFTYTVKYYQDGQYMKGHDGQFSVKQYAPIVNSVSYANMPQGYKVDDEASTPLPYEVSETNKIINVYYNKDDSKEFAYTVKYYQDGQYMEGQDGQFSIKQYAPIVNSVSYTNMPQGYKVDDIASTPLPYHVDESNNTIFVYYVKDDSKVLRYTVKYYQNDQYMDGEDIRGEVKQYDPYVKAISYDNQPVGYKLNVEKSTNIKTFKVSEKNNTVSVYYEKDDRQRYDYTVNYYVDDEFLSSKDLSVPMHSPFVYSVEDKRPQGYIIDVTKSTLLPYTVSAFNHTIEVYYRKDITKWATITFNQGDHGTLQEASGDVQFEVLKGKTLSESNVLAPTIIANQGYKVAAQAWNPNYVGSYLVKNDVTFVAQYEAITRDKEITVQGYEGVYDAATHTFEVNNTVEGDVIEYSYDNKVSWTTTKQSYEDVVDTKVYVRVSNNAYATNVVVKELSIIITPKKAIISTNSNSKTVLELDPVLTANISGIYEKDINTVVYQVERDSGEAVGIYNMFVTILQDNSNYQINTTMGLFMIRALPSESLIVTFNDANKKYNSEYHQLDAATVSDKDATIMYSTDEENWSNTMPSYNNAGIYQVFVKVTHPNYSDSVTKSATLTIEKADVIITPKNSGKVFKQEEPRLSADVLGLQGLDTFTGSYTVVREIGEDVGNYQIRVNDIVWNNTNYNVRSEKATFVITPLEASELQLTLQNDVKEYNKESYQLALASVSDTNQTKIEYLINHENWSTTMPSCIDAGRYTVYARASNPNYRGIAITQAVLTINPKAIVIAPENATKAYHQEEPELTAKVTGLIAGDEDTLSYQIVRQAGEEVGKTYIISISNVSHSTNYVVNSTTANFTITPLEGSELGLALKGKTHTFNNQEVGLDKATLNDMNDAATIVRYSVDQQNWDTAMPQFSNAGTYTIYAQASNPNYTGVANAQATLKIEPKEVVITLYDQSKEYKQADPKLKIDVLGLIEEDTIGLGTISVTRLRGELVGMYPIHAQFTSNPNYQVSVNKANFSITPLDSSMLTLKFEGDEATYDGKDKSLKDAIASDTKYTSIMYSVDQTNWTTSMPSFKEAGTYVIYAKAMNKNYSAEVTTSATLTIHKAAVRITAKDHEKLYGSIDPTLDVVIKGIVDGDTFTGSYDVVREKGEQVGNYKITVDNIEFDSNNYTVVGESGNFEILPLDASELAIDFKDNQFVYDATRKALDEAIVADPQNTTIKYSIDHKQWSTTMPTFEEAGSYIVYVMATNSNYTGTAYTQATLTINQRDVSVIAGSASKKFDNKPLIYAEYTSENIMLIHYIREIAFMGIQTAVGSSSNVVSDVVIVDEDDNDVTKNYNIKYVEGTLEVVENLFTLHVSYSFAEESSATLPQDVIQEINYLDEYRVETPFIEGYVADQKVVQGIMPLDNVDVVVIYQLDRNGNEIPDEEESITVVFEAGTNGSFSTTTQTIFTKLVVGDATPAAPTPSVNAGYVFTGYSPAINPVIVGEANTVIRYVAQYALIPVVVPTTPITTLPGTTIPGVNAPTTPITPETINPEPTPKADVPVQEEVKEDVTPKAKGQDSWALMNLLCSALTILLTLLLLLSKHQKEDEEKEETYQRRRWTKAFSTIVSIVSVVIFLFTENIFLPMIWFDKWTIVMAIIALVQVATFFVGRKWKDQDQKQEQMKTNV